MGGVEDMSHATSLLPSCETRHLVYVMQGVCRANIAHLSRPIAHEVLGVLDLTSRHIMPRLDELSASQIAHVAKAIATMVEMDDVASRMEAAKSDCSSTGTP